MCYTRLPAKKNYHAGAMCISRTLLSLYDVVVAHQYMYVWDVSFQGENTALHTCALQKL